MPKTAEPERLALTREDMEKILERGETVIHKGEHITKVEDLPDDVDLAIGDADAEQATLAEIDRDIEALRQQKARLAAAASRRAEARQARAAAAPAAEREADEKPSRRKKAARRRVRKAEAPTASAGTPEGESAESDAGE